MKSWEQLREVQPLAVKIMMNSFLKNRVSHAYLIQGTRGTGKKTFATMIAMTIFCPNVNNVEPCQSCHTCKRILSGNHPDVHWIEPEGKSIKTEQIRALQHEFGYRGMESAKKVYIITNAEALTVNASNRILKFLEEPEVETTALLLTDNGQSIIPTIQSRCQILELKPLQQKAFINRLMADNDIAINESQSRLISELTNNISEARTLHEEEKVYEIKDVVYQLIYQLIANYEDRYLFMHQTYLPKIKDKQDQELGLDLMLLAFKDILNFRNQRVEQLLFFQSNDGLLNRAIEQFSEQRLLHILQAILEAKQKLNQNVHPTLVMEQLVLRF